MATGSSSPSYSRGKNTEDIQIRSIQITVLLDNILAFRHFHAQYRHQYIYVYNTVCVLDRAAEFCTRFPPA